MEEEEELDYNPTLKRGLRISTARGNNGSTGAPPALSPTAANESAGLNSALRSAGGSIISSGSQYTMDSKNDDRASLNSAISESRQVSELLGSMSISQDPPKSHSKSRSSALGGSKLIQKLKRDNGVTISPPGTCKEGPWSDSAEVSPIITRKFENNGAQKIHVFTIGKPFYEGTEEVRRIKIYEHQTNLNSFDFPLYDAELRDNPKIALKAIEPFLRAPNVERKMVDKILSRSAAIKALTAAQSTLVPLYGGWLNSILTEDVGIAASSDIIYLVEYCPKHGAVTRSLPPLRMPAFNEDVKSHLQKYIGKMIEKLWDGHSYSGFSFALVSPLGRGDTSFHP